MPTRYPHGLTTAAEGSTLGTFILPDASTAHVFFDDFTNFDSSLWNIQATGGNVALDAATPQGAITLTGPASDQDVTLQTLEPTFTLEAGKQLWVKAKITIVSVSNETAWVFGLQTQAGDAFGTPNGVYIQKRTTPNSLNLDTEGMTPATTTLDSSLLGSTFEIGYHFDGVDTFDVFVDDVMIKRVVITSSLLGDTLAITAAEQTDFTAGGARSIRVDYLFAAKER